MSLQFLSKDYLAEGQTLDERVDVICETAERILCMEGFAKRFKENIQKGWYSLSTPVWTNFGTDRGLPISCFGSHVSDNMESILTTAAEVGMMTKHGGGTSAYFGDIRPRGSKIRNNGISSGAVHFMQLFENITSVVSQGSARRGHLAAFLPIDHPDIREFLGIRSEGHPIQHLSFGVSITDEWMQSMIDGDAEKRVLWAKVLETRVNTGYPYIFFTDTVNNGAPECYRQRGYNITHTNMCTEIALPDFSMESFVCCLASMNILYYDEWKDTDAAELLTFFLDAVMSEFIEKAQDIPYMKRAVTFARNHRALGIGWLGWHSYLQSKMIPFESMDAKYLNVEIAKRIKYRTYAASAYLASVYGETPVTHGTGRRNATLLAIAPTKSSSFIIGQVSEGIEPHRWNYYIKDLQKGKFSIKNPYLQDLLRERGKDTSDIWDSIKKNAGSVQHLDCLTDHEKQVFKTFAEISPMETIIQAAQRQKYIDQAQSLNLMIHPKTPVKDINALVIEAWKLGVKTLYYQIGVNAAQEVSRNLLSCSSCEA